MGRDSMVTASLGMREEGVISDQGVSWVRGQCNASEQRANSYRRLQEVWRSVNCTETDARWNFSRVDVDVAKSSITILWSMLNVEVEPFFRIGVSSVLRICFPFAKGNLYGLGPAFLDLASHLGTRHSSCPFRVQVGHLWLACLRRQLPQQGCL